MKQGEPRPGPAQPGLFQTDAADGIVASRARAAWSLATSNTSLAILDQAIVSGTRFLTTIFIGRQCGKDELGIYTLTFAIYLIFACMQEALISTPYTVFGNRLHGQDRNALSGSVLVHSVALSIVGLLAILVGLASFWVTMGVQELMPTVLAMALVLPFVLLWEFGRRYAIAHLNISKALALDAVTATLQVAGITSLAWQSKLTSASGFLAMGIGCACSAVGFCWLHKHEFLFPKSKVIGDWKKHWIFGRWVLAGQIIGLLQAYAPAWVLLIAIGPWATGVFSACENIVLLSNPLILAMANLFGATTARAFSVGGYSAVRKVVDTTAICSSLAMGVLWLVLLFAGGEIVTLIYGAGFAGHGFVVSTIALAAPLWAMSCALSVGLRAVERPSAEFGGKVAGFLITLTASIALVSFAGIKGMAVALLLGSLATTCWQAWAFYWVVPRELPQLDHA